MTSVGPRVSQAVRNKMRHASGTLAQSCRVPTQPRPPHSAPETAASPAPEPPSDPPAVSDAAHSNSTPMAVETQTLTEPPPQPQSHQASPPPSGEDDDVVVVSGASVGGDAAASAASAGNATMEERVRGPWSPEEDAVLSDLVEKLGARNWTLIARGIPGRSGKSCRLRWCNQLDPQVKRKPFTGIASFHLYIAIFSP